MAVAVETIGRPAPPRPARTVVRTRRRFDPLDLVLGVGPTVAAVIVVSLLVLILQTLS